MNYIENIRSETEGYFKESIEAVDSGETFFSPNRKFKAVTKSFKHSASNIEIVKVEIFYTGNSERLFSFLVNEWIFFHSWVTKNGIDYLLCAEDLCGGQTVIDLTNRKMSSFTTNDDGFIWTKHLLSPNEKLLAVFGCGWGSAFFTIIYHFDSPMELPLKIAKEPDWTGFDIIKWIDDSTLEVKDTEIDKSLLKF